MLGWITGFVDRLSAAAGGLVFAQVPLVIQQYTQELVGREAELRLLVENMRNAAQLSGKTLQELIEKFLQNPDIDVVRQGEFIQNSVVRLDELNHALVALQQSSLIEKPFVFLTNLNTDVLKSTLHHFTFGLPFSQEGGVYTLLGVAAGYLIFAFLKALCRKLFAAAKRLAIQS